MKNLIVTLLILMPGLRAIAAPVLGGVNTLAGAEIRTCQTGGDICLTVKSERTVGSQLQQLHRLKNPTVTIEDRKKKTSKELKPENAYLDLTNGQIVWTESRKKNKMIEVSYDLKTLERMETEL
ncbi:MAG: hypothetical protein KF789_05310 [Bdellovibrionaceae bacterium]|nr:hypothetical protein [Pseudobdellovibrionaceae bacterium]